MTKSYHARGWEEIADINHTWTLSISQRKKRATSVFDAQHDLVFPDLEAPEGFFARDLHGVPGDVKHLAGFFIDEVVVRRDVRVEDHDASFNGCVLSRPFSANRLSVL